MNLKNLWECHWFVRVVLVLWLISSVFVLFMLGRIDEIVNVKLYDFGLQFSLDWAGAYWAFLRLIYVFLAIPIVLSVAVLGLGFLKKGNSSTPVVVKREEKPTNSKAQPLKENHMVISCPNCKRVFSKPLVMLDFSEGKAKLVNVCPYCSALLGEANKSEDERDVETRVLSPDEKKKIRKVTKKSI